MAWATDVDSGSPIYILQLGKDRAASQCRCICPSCEQPLVAVNAAKQQYLRRPHFRHPNGAPKNECLFLAARLAALHLLQQKGYMMLPARRQLGVYTGMSGHRYETWVEHPPEKAYFTQFDFNDKARAILTLDDGRTLTVHLTGTGIHGVASAHDGTGETVTPIITVSVEDPMLAGMSPEALLSRVTLVPDSDCWVTHWNDVALQEQALANAIAVADEHFDWLNPDEALTLEPEMRRESLLHFEIKKIIAAAKEIRVPALKVAAVRTSADGAKLDRAWQAPPKFIAYWDAKLEQNLGSITPDVMATVSEGDGHELLFEVTVANPITQERLQRIAQYDRPTLEIDISALGGRVTRSSLADLVLNGIDCKRWLHHPALSTQLKRIESELQLEVEQRNALKKPSAFGSPLESDEKLGELLRDYLAAVKSFAELDADSHFDLVAASAKQDARERLTSVAQALAQLGYPEALEPELASVGYQGIIPRILAVKYGGGYGQRQSDRMAVLSAYKQIRGNGRAHLIYYFYAEREYRSRFDPSPPAWYVDWTKEVFVKMDSWDPEYIRSGTYDRFIAALFPEMAKRLAKRFGIRPSGTPVAVKRVTFGNAAVQAIVQEYSTGHYSEFGRTVDFKQILQEAHDWQGNSQLVKFYQQCNARYQMDDTIFPIARLLDAAGHAGAMDAWHDYNQNRQLQPATPRTWNRYTGYFESVTEQAVRPKPPSGPSYADLKGRVRAKPKP